MRAAFYWLIVPFLASNSVTAAAADLSPIQAKALQLMQAGHRLSSGEMESMLETDRAQVLGLIHKIARSEMTAFMNDDGSGTNVSSVAARRVLLRLPDPEVLDTIGKQLSEYQLRSPYSVLSSNLFDEAVRAKQPRLIPYLAQGLFAAGDAYGRDVELDGRKTNRSMESFLYTMRLAEAVEEFTPYVRGWARAMQGAHHLSNNEKREIGRAWWKDNESAILAGNYAAVRPGISPAAGMPRTQPNVPPNPDDARRVGPPRKPDTRASEPNVASKAGAADIATLPAPGFIGWLPWAGAAIILAAAAGWLFLRLRGKKN